MRQNNDSSAILLGQVGYEIYDANGSNITKKLTGQDLDRDGIAWCNNRVVGQGLAQLLNAGLRGTNVLSSFFLAPFAANVAPPANLTAATFPAALTEFTNYNEANRPAWVPDGDATADEPFLTNAASPALITIGAGAQRVIWGAALVSVAGKGATGGVCIAAQKRTTGLNVEPDFELRMRYRINGTSNVA